MRLTVIPIVAGTLGMISKCLGEKKGLEELIIRGKLETIQIAAFLRLARILRSVLET